MRPEFWRDRRVFVTGHTGFKGGWLALCLHALGARVHGYSLPPPTDPSLFDVADVAGVLDANTAADIRDLDALERALQAARPDAVFHLAAQALVRPSYSDPVGTYTTNVIGTVNLLEAVRRVRDVRSVVIVTSDKCYENDGRDRGYRETDAMGGFDPYSSSKGCAELATAAFRRSYFSEGPTAVASVRAGNIVGGGDWALDRLVPDFFRALDAGVPLRIRAPNAIRPWQHVLEPVAGYLALAEALATDGQQFAEGWNFGPPDDSVRTVSWIVDVLRRRACGSVEVDDQPQPHEANHLTLDSGKARRRLPWAPRWSIETALERTIDWHRAWRQSADMRRLTLDQIAAYQQSESRLSCHASTSAPPGLTVSS
jgi:CDP-glucose 4,6-dehydratase